MRRTHLTYRIALTLAFGALAAGPSPSAEAATGVAVTNPSFTLRAVDARCFYAPGADSAIWPFQNQWSIHRVRSGLNDPRSPVHYGIDVWATSDHQAVYAMQSGVLNDLRPGHFWIGSEAHGFHYWHVVPQPDIRDGQWINRGRLLGHVFWNYWHVHISEHYAACGFVDPRRPTGAFHDPYNTEAAVIGTVRAFRANSAAYPMPRMSLNPSTLHDPSTPLRLDSLSGRVDFRAAITDLPRRLPPMDPALGHPFPEHRMAPAAFRAYLAPVGRAGLHLGTIFVFDGSRPIPASAVPTHWAFGTWREDACYYHWRDPAATCAQQIVWHTARSGFDTTAVPNGPYLWCIQALTINGVPSGHCTSVTIRN
jgi:hypothetical protein